jgi:hypothetical protein
MIILSFVHHVKAKLKVTRSSRGIVDRVEILKFVEWGKFGGNVTREVV